MFDFLTAGVATYGGVTALQSTKFEAHVMNVAGRQRMLNQKHARMILAGNEVGKIRQLITASLEAFKQGGDKVNLEGHKELDDTIPQQTYPKVLTAITASEENFKKVFAIADAYAAAKSESKKSELVKELSLATDESHKTAHGLVLALGAGIRETHKGLIWQMIAAGAVTALLGLIALIWSINRAAMPLRLAVDSLEESSASMKEGTVQLAATGQQVASNTTTQARACKCCRIKAMP